MGSCFALVEAHQHGSRRVKDPLLPRRIQTSNPSVHGRHLERKGGEFLLFSSVSPPLMHLPSKLHSMEANPGSEIRNPGLWSPEYSLRIPLTIKIQNPSSSYGDWNPVPGILKSVMEWNRESQIVMDSRDIALQVLSSRSLQPGADCWCSSVWLRISLNPGMGSFWTIFCAPTGMPCFWLLACK